MSYRRGWHGPCCPDIKEGIIHSCGSYSLSIYRVKEIMLGVGDTTGGASLLPSGCSHSCFWLFQHNWFSPESPWRTTSISAASGIFRMCWLSMSETEMKGDLEKFFDFTEPLPLRHHEKLPFLFTLIHLGLLSILRKIYEYNGKSLWNAWKLFKLAFPLFGTSRALSINFLVVQGYLKHAQDMEYESCSIVLSHKNTN